jgi:hypothetical protein
MVYYLLINAEFVIEREPKENKMKCQCVWVLVKGLMLLVSVHLLCFS